MDLFKNLTNGLIRGGLLAYDAVADRSQMPSNRRVYLDTFARDQTGPITAEHFKPDELQTIRKLVLDKMKAYPGDLQGSIQYKDYLPFLSPKDTSQYAGVDAGNKNPFENIRTTLGQFNYKVDPKTGGMTISDQYDFNPLKSRKYNLESRGDYIVNSLDPFAILRMYGEANMPEGRGRPVNIAIPGLLAP